METDMQRNTMSLLVTSMASELAALLKPEFERLSSGDIQPALLTVKQAAIYLARTEQAVQHLIFQRDLPVVRVGRRVHLHRKDLDVWIEANKV
jgi:excisionase family DNA binding protein